MIDQVLHESLQYLGGCTGIGINLRKTRRENDKDHMYELYKIFVASQLSMQHKEVVVKHVCLCVENCLYNRYDFRQ